MQRVTYKAAFKDISDSGEFEAILSAPTLDRDGEIIDSRAFEPLPDVIPMHRDHDLTTRGLAGYATPFYGEDGLLRAKGTFFGDADGQRMRMYAKTGVLSVSVGFMAAERSRDAKGIDHVTRAELLEASFVSVPSNREAAITAVKSATATEAPERTVKAVEGSYERLADRLSSAVSEAIGDRVWPKGTFSDSFLFERLDADTRTFTTYSVDWVEVDGEIVLDAPKAVDLVEVVRPLTKTAAAAKSAAAPVADSGDTTALADWLERISTMTKEVNP